MGDLSLIRHELCRWRVILQAIEENENYLLRASALLQQRRPRRSVWMKIRDRSFRDQVVLQEYTDEDCRCNFLMSRRTFDKFCGLMSEVMKPEDVTVRAPILLPMRVPIVLYKLASCAEYRVVANQFGESKSTVKKLVYLFCRWMVSSVIENIIRMPTAEEAIAIARRFQQKFHIPQIIGCIDGTHIPVLPPSDGYRDFVNCQGWPLYVLQAVVDDKYWFWSVSCKLPGSAHDANVFRQSQLFRQAHLLPKGPREINGVTINHFLLGDPAYPLMDWLMKGYTHSPRITPEQESFNVYLSSARTTVKIAFGRLKACWRVLMKRSDFHFTFSPYMITTCCALHNLCEDEKESLNPTWTAEASV
ncbi:hypothetical protein ACEWY4_009121 [Coilia grayii]|uniref:DDE Tnp4 domain-containing protein n=1 Tax=Coilia grayii TaxID=363190 RepID=A0ABD1K5I9_9TELE